MITSIRTLRSSLPTPNLIGIELNTSCPNIKNKPPPAYSPPHLSPLLAVLASHYAEDPTLPMGLKLPPYVYSGQFVQVIDALAVLVDPYGRSPITFLTCTNTLGSSILFDEQTVAKDGAGERKPILPTIHGGLAGESIHALSVGCAKSSSSFLSLSIQLTR